MAGKVEAEPEGSERHHVGRDREVGNAEQFGEPRGAEEDRHRFLGTDHRDGNHGDTCAHGNFDEAAATEAPEPVPVGVGLGRPLRPFGEDEDELSLITQNPHGVVGMSGNTADAGPHCPDPRCLAEEVVGQPIDRAPELLFDAVHDYRSVGRDGAGVVRH